MRKVFNSDFKITQPFGVNENYYKKFGLRGHEGIDLIPSTNDWSVLCLEDGKVVRDEDNPRSGAYGIFVTVWHPKIKKATQYCHLEKNNVNVDDEIKKGQVIGKMGATGNVTGAHLHLNLFETDDNGYRLNTQNGYLGGIDPLPFLSESKSISIEKEVFEKLVGNSTKWDKTHSYLEIEGDPAITPYEKVQSVIAGFKSVMTDAQNKLTEALAELSNRSDQTIRLKAQVLSEEKMRHGLTNSLDNVMKKYAEVSGVYEGRISELQGLVDGRSKEIGNLKIDLAKCRGGGQNVPTLLGRIIKWLLKQ